MAPEFDATVLQGADEGRQLSDKLKNNLRNSSGNTEVGALIDTMRCTEFPPRPGVFYYMVDTRVIRVVSDRDRTMYANPDCLACSRGVGDPQILNNLMKDEVSALGLGKVPSFSVFFRLSDTEWSYMVNGRPVSPQIIACPDDQVYVPYYSECEPLDCPPHTFPFRGHCLLEDWNAADPSLQPLPNGTHQVYVTIFTEGPEFSDNNDTTLFSSDLEPNGTLCAGACWMGSNLANLFFILGPLVVTWVFNGVCFVLALCMIYRSGRVLGNMAKSKRQRVADRRRLAAYAA
nr:hypothetical protein BaRGS_010905 [Batillaria attramentaria]